MYVRTATTRVKAGTKEGAAPSAVVAKVEPVVVAGAPEEPCEVVVGEVEPLGLDVVVTIAVELPVPTRMRGGSTRTRARDGGKGGEGSYVSGFRGWS